ncbi:MAG: hypothetical protein ACRD1E_00150 [Terriglobales bacterium]
MPSLSFRFRRSLALRGRWRTLRLALLWCRFRLLHPRRSPPPGFDLEFSFETDRDGDTAGARKSAVAGVEYGPVDLEHFAALMRQVDARSGEFVFCDFGCGRGRALMLASAYPFRQIRGVDYDRDLVLSAQRHLERWARRRWPRQLCRDLAAEWADATTWAFPVAPSVFYFNEPLFPPALEIVAARIRASLAAAPRPAYVLYLGDWGQAVWEGAGDFETVYAFEGRHVYRWRPGLSTRH